MSASLPRLVLSEAPLDDCLRGVAGPRILLVADPYNHAACACLGRTLLVEDCRADRLDGVRRGPAFDAVVAVGGCTALDVGRALAGGRPLHVFPTILSTSCISVDLSVLERDGRRVLERTTAPATTTVCIPALLASASESLALWTASGFGDLLANVSAAIDVETAGGGLDAAGVLARVPEAAAALAWVQAEFQGFDVVCLRRLAAWLHQASLAVIARGSTDLSAAGEHHLYYRMIEANPAYSNARPTHGQLVAVGTLVAVAAFVRDGGDGELYARVRRAYGRLGLPVDYERLAAAGVAREQLLEGFHRLGGESYLGRAFRRGGPALLDEVLAVSGR